MGVAEALVSPLALIPQVLVFALLFPDVYGKLKMGGVKNSNQILVIIQQVLIIKHYARQFQDANGITLDGAILKEEDFHLLLLLEEEVLGERLEQNAISMTAIKLFVLIKLSLILVVVGSLSLIRDARLIGAKNAGDILL